MKATNRFVLVLITAPSLAVARRLARAVVSARLAACINLVPRIESHYRWQGKLETGAEVLLLCKTTKAKLRALEAAVLAKHPYDTPEFVVVPLSGGNARYLAWLADAVAPGTGHTARK